MPVEFSQARYIKLGKGGCWNDISLERGEIHFGFGGVSHELAVSKDYEAIRQRQSATGRKGNAASVDAGAIIDFYSVGTDCLWITFARGHLYWTFSEPDVIWVGGNSSGEDSPDHGFRYRKCLGSGWSKLDQEGNPLTIESLSTSLTKVAAYRGTVCRVSCADYLYRRINGLVDPLIERARLADQAMLDVMDAAIAKLHQADFETLADVMFASSGWHRTSAIGGSQEFIDLALEQRITGERAAVQVKSKADQAVLSDYISRFDALGGAYDRLFFVCHTTSPQLAEPKRQDVQVWQGRSLSEKVLRLGLTQWVLQKMS
jgi:hypothetical protein